MAIQIKSYKPSVTIKPNTQTTSVSINVKASDPKVAVEAGTPATAALDHTRLRNRNAKDQHSIEAITGLKETLEIATQKTYVHDQILPKKIWTIHHDLDCFPSVTIIDSANRVVIGEIQYLNKNEVILSFTAEFSGKAYLNS